MNKKDLIDNIAQETGLPKVAVADVLSGLIIEIGRAVGKGETVEIAGLCKIKVQDKPARTGRNPATGETIEIPAKRSVTIKASKMLNDIANEGW